MAAPSGTGLIAKRYATALIDMAEQDHAVEKIEKDFDSLQAMAAESPALQTLIRNPLFSHSQQQAGILALAQKAGFHDLSQRFLGVLARNRRLNVLESVIQALKTEINHRRGGVEAHVQTAYALTPAQTKELQKALSAGMGAAVALDVKVNKDILGGMIVTVGSRMIDDSVARKLERLKRTLSGGLAA